MDDARIVLEEIEALVKQRVPSPILDELVFDRDDTTFIKEGSETLRLRIYGRVRRGIWHPKWCFYEVGIGPYAPPKAEGENVGGISFFCAARQKVCGSGVFIPELCSILGSALAERPDSVTLVSPGDFVGGRERPWFNLQKRYRRTHYSKAPSGEMANDAAWLITRTFPQISAMADRN